LVVGSLLRLPRLFHFFVVVAVVRSFVSRCCCFYRFVTFGYVYVWLFVLVLFASFAVGCVCILFTFAFVDVGSFITFAFVPNVVRLDVCFVPLLLFTTLPFDVVGLVGYVGCSVCYGCCLVGFVWLRLLRLLVVTLFVVRCWLGLFRFTL